MSATQQFSVLSCHPRPRIIRPAMEGGIVSIQVNGRRRPNYNLTPPISRQPLITNLRAVPPFTCTDISATDFNRKFYRVLLGL